MTTPDYRFHREPPRRLTTVRTEVNATTTIIGGVPDAHPLSISFLRGIRKAILATAFFRSWHFIIIFTVEATILTYLYQVKGYTLLAIDNTLLAVLGTVLGFVISYRSSASFDRYNEGRRYWSQVVYNIRMFGKTAWYHVPDVPLGGMQLAPARNLQEYKARSLVEKKTVLNLLEGFAVALKHYLRGEEGCYYEDLYPLVKFLPQYALPAGTDVRFPTRKRDKKPPPRAPVMPSPKQEEFLPLPVTANGRTMTFTVMPPDDGKASRQQTQEAQTEDNVVYLLPSKNPPPYHIFDMWPFSLCIRAIQKRGMDLGGRKALRDRARNRVGADNVPLEITHYLSSYISSLQQRGVDGLTTGQMAGALSQLVDALTGLERILTTPIPWAYQVHLWTVTLVWLLALPFQVIKPMGWLAIPGVALAAFVYCGLMKCAEELENPFGYDYSDLNLDHFAYNIIRKELQAMMALPMPEPTKWGMLLLPFESAALVI
ncbi:hypothetical protein M408DRAFT_78157 [Serendipita vermifera MAFF 305830]|uniref:Uncharacterized protein n=1 Tax=Serendipita vermifera MAFF 305830 TaxID=933852 RepID=A0A0C3AEA2_SERVB|nr:hypothetical protein M408DRAFT_78157 [Serendipita vermifera MAFF 305830]